MKTTQQKILAATLKLLRPLARMLLRHGVSHSEFSELARKAFVETAFDDFHIDGKKQTVSRVATLTGLSRKEVLRLKYDRERPETKEPRPVNRAARVINGWITDSAFSSPDGMPRVLPLYGETDSFAALVRKYSGDITSGAIADELIRVGAAGLHEDGIELRAPAYVPTTGSDEKIAIAGDSASDLLQTLDHNLATQDAAASHLQRSVVYHQLPEDVVAEFRAFSEQKSAALLNELNLWLSVRKQKLSRYDLGTHRAGIGVYYFETNQHKKGSCHD